MRVEGLFAGEYKPDQTDEEGTTQYFSFYDRFGNWYIVKLIPVDTKSTQFRYVRSTESKYPLATAWANRTTLTFSNFPNSFKLGGSLTK